MNNLLGLFKKSVFSKVLDDYMDTARGQFSTLLC